MKKLKKIHWVDGLAVACLVAPILYNWTTGNLSIPEALSTPPDVAAVRMEIQRYMGYELQPLRYLSLPLDLLLNINEQLPLLDIGYILLLFGPVVFLAGHALPVAWKWGLALALPFLLTLSVGTGFIYRTTDFSKIPAEPSALSAYLSETDPSDAPAGYVSAWLYHGLLPIYRNIESGLTPLAQGKDAVTYPLLLLVGALTLGLVERRMRHLDPLLQRLVVFTFCYAYFWLLLSSGILWYGFLLAPLMMALIFLYFQRQASTKGKVLPETRFFHYAFISLTGLFLLAATAQRFSNIKLSLVNNDKLEGKRLLDPAQIRYLTGELDADGVLDAFYPGLSDAIQRINQDGNALVYNVGTRLNFFVDGSDKRFFQDNQLDYFQQWSRQWPTKTQLTQVLKNAGVKYLLVDYFTPTVDKTPEKQLVERYKNLMYFLYNNPGIRLVATDRIVRTQVDGQVKFVNDAYGDVEQFGNYAVFEIW